MTDDAVVLANFDRAREALDRITREHFYTLAQVAERMGWRYRTARSLSATASSNRQAGVHLDRDLPAPDRLVRWGRVSRPLWLRANVDHWAEHQRPGRGHGGGRRAQTSVTHS